MVRERENESHLISISLSLCVLGSFVRSNIDNSTTMSLTGLLRTLADKAKSCVRDLDPQNDLTFLRIRTKKQEILVAPGKSYFITLISTYHPRLLFR